MLSQSCFSNRAVKIFFVESEIEEMNLIFLFSLIAVFSQFASGIQWKCEFKVIDEKEFCVLDEFAVKNINEIDLNNVEFDEFAITEKVVNLKIEFFKLKSFPIQIYNKFPNVKVLEILLYGLYDDDSAEHFSFPTLKFNHVEDLSILSNFRGAFPPDLNLQSNFPKIQKLMINSAVNAESLNGLQNLIYLELEDYKLSSLSENIFSNLKGIKAEYHARRKEKFDLTLLKNSKNLEKIDISGYELVNFSNKYLEKNTNSNYSTFNENLKFVSLVRVNFF